MRVSGRLAMLSLSVLAWTSASACSDAGALSAGGHHVTGPYRHGNLSVFLIHGPERTPGRPLLTLQEAIEMKKVVVHETGQVNELAVENVSVDADVYIQSGDIVKGGRQDRMISQDFIVPARSGKMPIASFCVEQGRWRGRGSESTQAFNSSSEQAAGKALKMAARRADQGEVWRQVAAAQDRLSASLGAPVAASESASSLQLTLEHGKVKAGAEEYVRALSARGLGKDVVGCAFAVNGRLSSAEIYGSRALFRKLWPKLLKAAAVEAIAEQRNGPDAAAPRAADVKAWLEGADGARAEEKDLSPRMKVLTREAVHTVLFETRDREGRDEWLHRSYLAK